MEIKYVKHRMCEWQDETFYSRRKLLNAAALDVTANILKGRL